MTTDLTTTRHLPEQAAPPTLADVLDAALVMADDQRKALVETGDLTNLAHGLHQLRDITRKVSMLERQTDGDVARLVRTEGKRAEIPGLGTVEVHRRSTKTKWESDRIYGRLVDAIANLATIDPDTGEVIGDADTAERMAHLLREILAPCLPLTASMGWRVGGLKEAGIDPNTYREQEYGPDTARITTPDGL